MVPCCEFVVRRSDSATLKPATISLGPATNFCVGILTPELRGDGGKGTRPNSRILGQKSRHAHHAPVHCLCLVRRAPNYCVMCCTVYRHAWGRHWDRGRLSVTLRDRRSTQNKASSVLVQLPSLGMYQILQFNNIGMAAFALLSRNLIILAWQRYALLSPRRQIILCTSSDYILVPPIVISLPRRPDLPPTPRWIKIA